MSEHMLQLIAFLKLLWIAVFSYLYGLGGIKWKFWRRYCGAAWMCLGVYGFSTWTNNFHYWYLIFLPALSTALHIGYGGESLFIKLRKRFIYGLSLGAAALPLVFGNNLWSLYGGHVLLCILFSVFLGVFNIAKNARDEETLIATGASIVPLFLI